MQIVNVGTGVQGRAGTKGRDTLWMSVERPAVSFSVSDHAGFFLE